MAIQERLDFIGVDWVADEDDGNDQGNSSGSSAAASAPSREVRLLDYACGTGLMSRVSLSGTKGNPLSAV